MTSGRSPTWSKAIVVAAAATVAAAAGCSDNRERLSGAEVVGKVTLDGTPLPAGLVILSSDSSAATGSISPDGSYAVTNAPLGSVRVAVRVAHLRAEAGVVRAMQQRPPVAGAQADPSGAASGPPEYKSIPSKYELLNTSGITTTVGPGRTEFDIQLTTPNRP
jgi:hypothetical protein